MNQDLIIAEINARSERTYDSWQIGITHDPAAAKAYWEELQGVNTEFWIEWAANSLEDARSIEEFFVDRGMKSGGIEEVAPSRTIYVYVF